jgi:hypothetical protein
LNKIYHVFLSSTYADLVHERGAVRDAIAKAGYVCEGMELFPASSQKQLDFIKRTIDRCDYYVVVVAGRYGSTDDSGVSYTEREYEYAISRSIPTLAFLHRDVSRLPAGNVDDERDKRDRLSRFREMLSSTAMVDFWTDPGTLATSVVVALGQEVNLNPGVGWIRGNEAADPRVYEQLNTAQLKITELEARLSDLTDERVTFPRRFASIDSAYETTVRTTFRDGNSASQDEISVSDTWRASFLSISNELFGELPEDSAVDLIITDIMRRKGLISETAYTSARQDPSIHAFFRLQFEALGLINAVSERTPQETIMGTRYDRKIVWTLTEKGRRFIAQELAVPAPSSMGTN